jgi:hypothetical protein
VTCRRRKSRMGRSREERHAEVKLDARKRKKEE